MNKPNGIVFSLDDYESKDKMFEEIGKFIRIVSDAGYTCKTRYDERGIGIFSVEFDYDDPELADKFLEWLSYDEMEYLETMAYCEDYDNDAEEDVSEEFCESDYAKYAKETKEIYDDINFYDEEV